MANIDHYWPLYHAFQPSLAIIGMALISQIHIGLSVTRNQDKSTTFQGNHQNLTLDYNTIYTL